MVHSSHGDGSTRNKSTGHDRSSQSQKTAVPRLTVSDFLAENPKRHLIFLSSFLRQAAHQFDLAFRKQFGFVQRVRERSAHSQFTSV